MKRSEINQIIRDMETMIQKQNFFLPPFCSWTPEEWAEKGHEYDEIRDCMLGWDITDFGLGDFYDCGFGLLTLRNGNQNKKGYEKAYAEKLLYMHDYMYAAMHYHDYKSEDIINRGGGILEIKVYLDDGKGGLSNQDVPIQADGHRYTVPAGSMVRLEPGHSITIYPHLYHEFHIVKGSGDVLIGEVSTCNDDENDNFFYDQNIGRFPTIEEDEPPYRLLCNEYPPANG